MSEGEAVGAARHLARPAAGRFALPTLGVVLIWLFLLGDMVFFALFFMLYSYNKLDQKSVTAWLDLRNRAAHGRYEEYTRDQVELMVQAVTEFMARNAVQ